MNMSNDDFDKIKALLALVKDKEIEKTSPKPLLPVLKQEAPFVPKEVIPLKEPEQYNFD